MRKYTVTAVVVAVWVCGFVTLNWTVVANDTEGEEMAVAPPPGCGTDGLVLSEATIVMRRPLIARGMLVPAIPFHPVLVATHDGKVHLLSTSSSDCVLDPVKSGAVEVLTWSGGSWSRPFMIQSEDGVCRCDPVGVAIRADESWLAGWRERSESSSRHVARMYHDGQWQGPKRLTDIDQRVYDLGLVSGKGGKVFVFWGDDRERHFAPSAERVYQSVGKAFFKEFGDAAEAPAEQVSPRGYYSAQLLSPVRWVDADAKPELIFFRAEMNEGSQFVLSGMRDLWLTRREGAKWLPPSRLLKGASGVREEKAGFVRGYRTRSGKLLVVYVGGADGAVRVFSRDDGVGSATTVATGVADDGYGIPIRSDIHYNGNIDIVYQGRAFKRKRGLFGSYEWQTELGGGWKPYYVVRTDGLRCVSSAVVSRSSTSVPEFDVAVDVHGVTHVTWVEEQGTDAVLMHRTISTKR